ncbi:MAG: LPS-assembly protein [Lentimonas sp.]
MPQFVRLFFIALVICQFDHALKAALPELSSIDPIEFDEKAQRLIARGDARLDFKDTRLSADRITYYQKFGLADASGDVSIMKEGYRLIADRINYETEENIFSIDELRTGQWPVYISGNNAGGTIEHTTFQDITVYYGEPNFLTPSVNARKMEYLDEEGGILKLGATTFKIGNIPLLVLPGYTHKMQGGSPFFIDTDFGTRSELGTYFQTTTLFSVNSWLRLGANLDGYTQRGVLAGPTAQYAYDSATQTISGALSTGYLDDQDDSPNDINDEPIEPERGFVEWRHQHHIGERINITAAASYWSDSEVTRDFRQDYFRENQQPDTFVEGVYAGDNYLFSVFGRFQPNEFQLIQERLPEVRFDLLPVPIYETGAYQRFSTSYAHLQEAFDSVAPSIIGQESKSDRFDLTYRLERPTSLTDWLLFTPLVGARVTHYENQEFDPAVFSTFGVDPDIVPAGSVDDSFTRDLYELGFDLEAQAYATYSTINRTWDVDGLRHLLRPVLRYRYISDPGSKGEIAPIDREAFNLNRPLLNLSDLRNIDTISETHLARLGVENLFQTRTKDYGSRTLAALNFYQDILFERGTRYDGDEENAFHATWVELVLTPAPWLKFDVASRFKTEGAKLEELRSRTLISSGEIWEIGLSTDFLRKRIDQFRIDFMCRVNERISLLVDTRYDLETNQFTRTEFALATKLNNTWTIIYAVVFRQDAVREDDVQFSVRLNLADL